MKEIKDYLHLYLPFEFSFYGYNYKIIGFKDGGHFFHFWHEHGFFDVLKTDFKLPLRPLSDMTEEEKFILFSNEDNEDVIKASLENLVFYPQDFMYLLSKHFDIFNLIDGGLAIDKTTIK